MLPSYNGSGFTGPHLGLDTIDVNDLTDNVKNSLALQHPSFESITTEAYPSSPATSSSYFTGDDEVFGFDNTFNVNNIFTEDEDEDDGSNFSESDSDSDDEYVPSSSRRGSSSAKGMRPEARASAIGVGGEKRRRAHEELVHALIKLSPSRKPGPASRITPKQSFELCTLFTNKCI